VGSRLLLPEELAPALQEEAADPLGPADADAGALARAVLLGGEEGLACAEATALCEAGAVPEGARLPAAEALMEEELLGQAL
jgi:hypothetical protein